MAQPDLPREHGDLDTRAELHDSDAKIRAIHYRKWMPRPGIPGRGPLDDGALTAEEQFADLRIFQQVVALAGDRELP